MDVPIGWPYSGWLDLESLASAGEPLKTIASLHDEPFRFIREFLQNPANPSGFRRIDIGHSGLSHMAACSRRTRPPAGYAIAFDAATYLQLLMTVQRLLTVPSLLPNHTDQLLSEGPPLDLAFVQVMAPNFRNLFGTNGAAPQLSGGSHRYSILRQLVVDTVIFLFLHELAHIVEGHIDYRISQAAVRQHMTEDERYQLEHRDSTALEHLADIWAILQAAEIYEASGNRQGTGTIESLHRLGVAVGIVFLISEVCEKYPPSSTPDLPPIPTAHPSAYARLLVCETMLVPEILLGQKPDAKAQGHVILGIHDVLSAWEALGWKHDEILPTQTPRQLLELLSLVSAKLFPIADMQPKQTSGLES